MELISLHVPKTAGTSFRLMLMAIYGDQLRLDYDDFSMVPQALYNRDRQVWRVAATAEIAAIRPETRAVHGHFAIEKYNGAFPEARRIVWLRHPAAWITSLYYMLKMKPKNYPDNEPKTYPGAHPLILRLIHEDISLIEFAEDPMVRNRVSANFLAGLDLEAFSFVGIQEHFDEDIRDLKRMMDWPDLEVPRENSSPIPNYGEITRGIKRDRAMMDRLISLYDQDMALYERALRLRERRIGGPVLRMFGPSGAEGDESARVSHVA